MPDIDPEIKALQDSIFLNKVARARKTEMSQRILDGVQLYDDVRARMLGGVRSQFPQYTEDEVQRELRRRLIIIRRIKDAGLYQPAGSIHEE